MNQEKPFKFPQPVSNGNHKQSNQRVQCPQNLSFENIRPHSQKEQFIGNINDKIKTEPNEELNQSLQQNQKQFPQKYFQQQYQNSNKNDQKVNCQPKYSIQSNSKPKEPDLSLEQQQQGNNQQQINDKLQQQNSKEQKIRNQSLAEPQQEKNNLVDVFQQYFLFNQNQIDPRTEYLLVSLNQGSNKNNGFTSQPDLDVQDLEFLNLKVLNHFKYKPRPVQFLALIELFNQQSNKGRLAQIYTGEGKSLIIAMLAVCLVIKKKVNVDIVTSSPVLAQRDAEKLSSFYKLFDIKASHNVTDEIKNTCYKCQVVYGDPSSFEGDILRHEYSEQNTMEDRKLNYVIVDEVDSMLIDGNSNKTILTSPKPGMLDVTKVLRLIWDEICKVEPQLSTDLKVMIIDKNDFYSIDLIEYIEKTLQIQIDTAIFKYLPKFRNSYVNSMKTDWIKNAIQAKFQIKENKHYIVENNKIRIVDFQNTGVIHLDNMQWERGLHQFVQMKHKIPITPLTISTNFLSNVGFFTRYSSQLLGLTGTLGSKATQNLLAQQYKVDFVFIPPNKTRQIQIYEPIVVFNEREWQQAILRAVTEMLQTHRAVLIIHETIKEVKTIGQLLQNNNIQCIQYSDNSQNINMNITQQQVIVATNLAGRGTDLVTDEKLEQSGGLHVILSFLPRNVRIEEQAIGRTGRQGRKGSAQLILNFNDFHTQNTLSEQEFQLLNIIPFEFMKSIRDKREIKYAESLKIEMDKLLNEDKCFQKFCQVAKSKANLKKEPAAFRAIEERWGIYLEQNKGNLNEGEIEQIINSTEDENPKYLIQKGLEKNSIEMYNRAIQISENDPYAYYYKGMQEIKNNKLQEAAKDLLKARELLQNKIEDEQGFQLALKMNQNVIEKFQLPKDFDVSGKNKTIQIDEAEIKNQNPLFENNNRLLNNNRQEFNSNRIEQNKNRIQQNSNSLTQNNNNNSLELLDQKFNNQIKVYNNLLQNIEGNLQAIQTFNPKDEEIWVKWTPMLSEEEKKNPNLSQEVKDKEEIVADGPLPKMGEVRKKKKEPKASSWWLIALGVVQVLAGFAICALTGGAALPIGKALIQEGVSDIVTGAIALWKGEEIDWEAWRNRKALRLATAISMAGSAGIREIVDMGKKFAKSFQQIGLKEMLKSLPQMTVKGLQNAGLYIPAAETNQLNNSLQAIEQIEKVAFQASGLKEVSLLVGQVLNDQVDLGLLPFEEASQLQEIVSMSLNEASSTKGFTSLFGNLAKNYLQVKIARDRLNKNNEQSKAEVTQLCQQKNQEMFEQKKANLQRYKQYKTFLQNELRQLSQLFWICFQNDSRATNILLGFDFFLEEVDQNKVKDILTVDKFRIRLNSKFDITNQSLVSTLKKLVISDKKSIEQLYIQFVKPIVHSLFADFRILNDQQPFEIVFFQSFNHYFTREKNNLENASSQLDEEKQQIEHKQQHLSNTITRLKENIDWIKQNEKNQQLMINQLNQIKREFQNINEGQANQLNQAINNYNQRLDYYKNQVQLFNSNIELRKIAKNSFRFLIDRKFIIDDIMPNRNQILQGLDLYFKTQNIGQNKIKLIQQIMENAFVKIRRVPNQLFSGPFKEAVEMEIIDPIKQFLNDFRIEQAQKQV